MTNQQAPEIYALHTVPNEGKKPWFGIYAVRADAEHDAKVMRDATGRDWSVVRLVVADTAATPTGPITRYEVVDCIDSKHVPAVIPNGAGPWVRYEDHVAALVEAQQPAKAESLRQILTDPENQPNQYGVEFGMSGQQMHFKIGNQLFRLAYEPDDQQKFEFMKRMLIHAFSTFTPDVKMAQHPAPSAAAAGQRRSDLVPGVMHCAKCKFQLNRVTLCVSDGNAYAGNNETEPCPNGCGPLWPVTWEQEARNCWKALEEMHERLHPAPTTQADSQPALDRDRIREIFMAHGFTVKEGQTDLKQYVYDAADALLRTARAPADSVTATAGGAAELLKEILAEACCEDSETNLTGDHYRRLYDLQSRIQAMLSTPHAQTADSVLEDAARLDFLIDQRAYVVSDPDACPGHWLRWARPDGSTWVQVDAHPTPRAAIDAARKQGANHD